MDILKKNFSILKTIKYKCPKNVVNKTFKNYKKFTKKKNILNAIQYISKLNIPLLPKNKSNKQVVFGTTKYLLPYFCLTDYFEVFALDPNNWTLDKNNMLLNTIVKLNENVIRLVSSSENMINNDNSLRITAKEICILLNNNYEIYKLLNNNAMIENIYFLIKKDNTIKIENNDLILIDKENVVFYI
jgi:hypothetical protein